MEARFEEVLILWEQGQRAVLAAEPPERLAMEQVIDALVGELRHRLGGAFTSDELARLYMEQGTDWCFDIATRVAPNAPAAWDITTVGGAAFARYVRAAMDFGGGRRREDEH